MTLVVIILGAVTLQRLAELVVARRNTTRLRARGGYEVGAGQYRWIVLLHAAWLGGLWYAVLAQQVAVDPLWLAVFVGLQILRLWIIASLGGRWTTRIIVVPGAPLVAAGPYRFLRHPNYWVVAAEILVLPLCFGLIWFGMAFSLLNALVLLLRIRAEDAALRPRRQPW